MFCHICFLGTYKPLGTPPMWKDLKGRGRTARKLVWVLRIVCQEQLMTVMPLVKEAIGC